jgi:uncharacterized membrane protein YgdD (TMEM256/DUF423 family)
MQVILMVSLSNQNHGFMQVILMVSLSNQQDLVRITLIKVSLGVKLSFVGSLYFMQINRSNSFWL